MDGLWGWVLGFGVFAVVCIWAGGATIWNSSFPDPDAPARSYGRLKGLALLSLPFAIVGFLLWCISLMQFPSFNFGRSLRIKNRPRLPTITEGDGWAGEPITLRAPLSDPEREVLGEMWTEMARAEHASVPAFSLLAIQLTALGAPAHLLRATHRAALEEIEHAERCFAIARAITGDALDAGPIDALLQPTGDAIDLSRLALESLTDGCLGEGVAADLAARGAAIATEPAVITTLTAIAREEAAHAELAWQILAWSLEQGGGPVRRTITLALERLASHQPSLPRAGAISPATLARFGHVDQATSRDLCAFRLLAVTRRTRALLEASYLQAAA